MSCCILLLRVIDHDNLKNSECLFQLKCFNFNSLSWLLFLNYVLLSYPISFDHSSWWSHQSMTKYWVTEKNVFMQTGRNNWIFLYIIFYYGRLKYQLFTIFTPVILAFIAKFLWLQINLCWSCGDAQIF